MNSRKTRSNFLITCLAGLALSSAALAQGTTYEPLRDPQSQPMQPERKDAQQPRTLPATGVRQVTLVPGEWAIGADVVGSDGQTLGEINDLIIDNHHGKITFALMGRGGVLGIGETVYAVPCKALSWNAQRKVLMLPMTQEQIKEAPSMSASDWKTLDESSRIDSLKQFYRVEGSETAHKPAARTGQSDAPRLIRVSELRGSTINGDDGREVGTLNDLIYDASSGKVALVAVTFGGVLGIGKDKVAVPYPSFAVNREGKLYTVKLDKDKVQSGPRLQESDWAELKEPGYAARVYSHYGADASWMEQAAAGGAGTDRLFAAGTTRQTTGTIAGVERDKAVPGYGEITCIKVQDQSGETINVHLAPQTYLQGRDLNLNSGDRVTVKGRWVNAGDKSYLVATEVVTGDGKIVTLRNDNGDPAWSGR